VYRATPFLVANSSLDRINIQTSSEKISNGSKEGGGVTYQSRATWTLASASSLPPLQHTEEAHELRRCQHNRRGKARRRLGRWGGAYGGVGRWAGWRPRGGRRGGGPRRRGPGRGGTQRPQQPSASSTGSPSPPPAPQLRSEQAAAQSRGCESMTGGARAVCGSGPVCQT